MAALIRTSHSARPLPVPLKPLTSTWRRPPYLLFMSNSAHTSPVRVLTSPVSKTLVSISKTLTLTRTLAEAMMACLSARPSSSEEATIQALRSNLSMAGTGAAAAYFASISTGSVSTPLTVVASGMAKWLELYSGVLMLRVLLSWFPNIPWERQPLQAIRDMCDPYLNLFRNIIPPLFNALDVSPLLAFLVLGVLTSILNSAVQV